MSEFKYNKLLLFARFFLLFFGYLIVITIIMACISYFIGYKDLIFGITGVVNILEVLCIPSLVLAIITSFFGRIKIQVCDDRIIIKKVLKSESISFKDYSINSYTLITTVNQIKANTTRYIHLKKYGTECKERKIPCLNFRQKHFSIMLATIQSKQKRYWNKVNGVVDSKLSESQSLLIKKYDIPSERINKAGFRSKQLKINLLILLVFQFLSYNAYQTYAETLEGYKPFIYVIIVIIFQILTLVICLPKIIMWFATRKKIKKETPKTVEVYNNKLVIDNKIYSFKDISMIIASPSSYIKSYFSKDRYIKIFLNSSDNKGIMYRFGPSSRTTVSKKVFFEKYPEFCSDLEEVYLESGKLVYDL